MKKIAFLLFFSSCIISAQVSFPNPVRFGGALPATCTPGAPSPLFFVTTAGPNGELYKCTATDTWTATSGGGGSGTVTSVGLTGTANQITVTGASPITTSGSWALSIPTNPTLPGTTTGTFSGSLTGNVTGNADTATALAANPTDCAPGDFATAIAANGDLTCATPAGGGTVTVVGGGSLTSTALVTGGGTTALQTPSATATMDASGNISTPGSISTGAGGSTAGALQLGQGTAATPAANSIVIEAPAAVTTAYKINLAGAAATGLPHYANSANVITETISAVVAADTDNSIAHTGVDVNTSYQVTATHLAAALPVNQGGTGTISTLTGLMRGNASAMTAAELSGDATTSGSNAVTLASRYKVKSCVVVVGDPGAASAALADDNDSPVACTNDTGGDWTLTWVGCWANAGSPTITPILTGGTSTSILSGALTCGTAAWAAGSLNGSPVIHSFSAGATCSSTPCTADVNITTAGGTAKYIVVRLVGTY